MTLTASTLEEHLQPLITQPKERGKKRLQALKENIDRYVHGTILAGIGILGINNFGHEEKITTPVFTNSPITYLELAAGISILIGTGILVYSIKQTRKTYQDHFITPSNIQQTATEIISHAQQQPDQKLFYQAATSILQSAEEPIKKLYILEQLAHF
ncbi:MAG: hypothetical protein Q7R56_02725 [Nanoarchaeota archaeon]|nr:hypothetical protein [Nanoarchaeota archaeon]